MRRLLAATIIAAVTVVLMPTAGSADPYKWCAVYGGDMGGASNCGFVTIEQCRATVSGIGGFCDPNPFYTGPAERPARRARKN
jgi:Protein of unknown function (DUF3551)